MSVEQKASEAASDLLVTTIRRSPRWTPLNLGELWRYRDMSVALAMREIKVRYKQTVLGVAWVVLQPLFTMVIFTLVFNKLLNVNSGDVRYPIFAFAAIVPWTYFSYILTHGSNSLIQNMQLITKVYFPKLAAPLSTLVAGFVDFVISMAILVAMLVYFDVAPTWRLIALPAFLLLMVASALAVSLWVSAFSVFYRDFRAVVPFVGSVGMYLTPIAYPSSLVPERFAGLYWLNPMVGVVEGFRWALFGNAELLVASMAISVAFVALLLIGGAYYFRSVEMVFADRI